MMVISQESAIDILKHYITKKDFYASVYGFDEMYNIKDVRKSSDLFYTIIIEPKTIIMPDFCDDYVWFVDISGDVYSQTFAAYTFNYDKNYYVLENNMYLYLSEKWIKFGLAYKGN